MESDLFNNENKIVFIAALSTNIKDSDKIFGQNYLLINDLK